MEMKLSNLFSDIITGDWGEEDTDGKDSVNIIKTTNFRNDGSISFDNIEKRVIRKKIKGDDGNPIWIIDEDKIEKKKLQDKDIIIEKSGGGAGTPVGRVVYFENPDANTYICNNFTQVLRVDESKVYPKYLFYYLRYLYNKGTVLKYQNQTIGLFNLKLSRYLNEEVDLIPFDLQYSVVAQLDTIQNLIDERIKTIKINNSLISSTYRELFGHPITNPYKFKKKKLFHLGKWQSGGTPNTSVKEYYSGNIPWFTSGELGGIYIEKSNKYISNQAIEESNTKIIEPNSLLIGMYDTAAFKMSINKIECSCNQAILFSKLNDDFYLLFVYYTLLLSKDYYLQKRKGARQKNLNASFIKNIEIIYPEDEPDKNKVLKFYEVINIVNELQEKLVDSLSVLQNLFHAILQNAFRKDSEIDEEPIFKELIKKLALDDLRGNKKRLQYLINLFQQNKFDDDASYSDAKEKLFELILKDEIQQKFENEKIILDVK